jgi:hypothetical protein
MDQLLIDQVALMIRRGGSGIGVTVESLIHVFSMATKNVDFTGTAKQCLAWLDLEQVQN